MKSDKLIEFLKDMLKFEDRLRLVENLICETDTNKKAHSFFSKEKCKSCCSKIDFAQLFYILMDEGLLYFDTTDEKNNRSKFQLFLEIILHMLAMRGHRRKLSLSADSSPNVKAILTGKSRLDF